ncbi:DMT family transporter [Cupriavidus sp. CV2]|uniref:DMT family transporter n=1 Tax=Cupriavidus ulmosensis TaxID=3065913 RepID=UPI00296B0B0E|nr:DMT family transporter [Cupriavidus sp. CV2]MDW3685295.1 DMT family transporter [Cupriavidus sp. CV2]
MPTTLAICALLIWSTLAVSVVSLSALPPLLTTGLALIGGGALGLPWVRWRHLRARPLLVGSAAMLGYHALYFLSLQTADPVAANLLHYLWPLFIIVLTPLMLRRQGGHALARHHVAAGLLGFAGAAACVGAVPAFNASAWLGYTLALVSALVWAYFSVWSRRFAEVPTSTVSLYCLAAGVVSLAIYAAPAPTWASAMATADLPVLSLDLKQWLTLGYLSLGPLGGAFYLWDYAMKKGNPQRIALFAYAVPVVSTLFVQVFLGRRLEPATLLGALLVTAAVGLGNRPAWRA